MIIFICSYIYVSKRDAYKLRNSKVLLPLIVLSLVFKRDHLKVALSCYEHFLK